MSEPPANPWAVPPGQPPPPPPPPLGYPPGYPPPGYPAGGYPGPYYAPPPPGPGRGLAIAALIFGLLSLAFFIPIGAPLCGLTAVILGIVAIRKAGRGKAAGRGMAIVGLITGLIGLVAGTMFSVWLIGTVAECFDETASEAQFDACIERQFS